MGKKVTLIYTNASAVTARSMLIGKEKGPPLRPIQQQTQNGSRMHRQLKWGRAKLNKRQGIRRNAIWDFGFRESRE